MNHIKKAIIEKKKRESMLPHRFGESGVGENKRGNNAAYESKVQNSLFRSLRCCYLSLARCNIAEARFRHHTQLFGWYPFARTEYKLNWIVNTHILSVNVLNFIRYSQRYLFMCLADRSSISNNKRKDKLLYTSFAIDFVFFFSLLVQPSEKRRSLLSQVSLHWLLFPI